MLLVAIAIFGILPFVSDVSSGRRHAVADMSVSYSVIAESCPDDVEEGDDFRIVLTATMTAATVTSGRSMATGTPWPGRPTSRTTSICMANTKRQTSINAERAGWVGIFTHWKTTTPRKRSGSWCISTTKAMVGWMPSA